MAIKTIEKLKTTDLGASNELACPVCGAVSQMRLFENTDGSMVAHLHKKPAQGLAVCPTVNPHYIAEKKNGTVCELEPQDLTVLVRGS